MRHHINKFVEWAAEVANKSVVVLNRIPHLAKAVCPGRCRVSQHGKMPETLTLRLTGLQACCTMMTT
jgi:hypothetical protein